MRTTAVIVLLLALLGLAGWFAVAAWNAFEGPPMPAIGWIALGAGVTLSLVVGCGLMALVFYSSRHGYDDQVIERKPPRRD
jgi:hypothetical protein